MKQQIQLSSSKGRYQRVDKQIEQELEDDLEDEHFIEDEHLIHIPEGGALTGIKSPKISIKDLNRFTDSGELILSGASLDIYSGTVVGIIGPSGSGKSTLLRALNRLWEPPPDSVFLDAQDITKLDVISVRRRVGMLFQLPALFDGTIADNLNYGPSLRGERLSHDKLVELLKYADLDSSFLSKSITGLSVGQAQRVALARTLANDPEVIQNSRFMALLQPPLPSQPVGTQKQKPEPVKAQPQEQCSGCSTPYKEGGKGVTFMTFTGFDDRKKALSFLQQFHKAYAGGNFTEASKVRKAATYLTGNAGQWWTTLLLQGQAPSTWIYFKPIFPSAWLSDDFEADVMAEWHQLNAATSKNLDDFNRKFGKLYFQKLPTVTTLTQLIEVANTGNGLLKGEDCEFNTGVKEGSAKKNSAKKYVLIEVPKLTQEPGKAWKGKAKAERAKGPAKKWKRPFPRKSEEQRQVLRSENKCFICEQPGHIASSCPQKKRPADSEKMKGKERLFPKLSMRYYRPFQICDIINDVAYRLKLPESWKIHNAFHVSLFRPYVGDVPEDMPAEDQPEVEELDEILVPEQILAHKERKVKGKVARRYLVKFRNYPPMDAKWMEEGELAESPTVYHFTLKPSVCNLP
ncbi:hypothetical protein L7F22_008690 [Adiantum nelumboides]|nr:hypothetical protein [Adiantum nelumboides]